MLVLDIGLPDADGRDLCLALRAAGVDAPVLFLTARDGLHDKIAGFEAGGDDYLTKPFELDEVRVRLDALLRRTPAPAAAEPGRAGARPGTPRPRRRRRRGRADARRSSACSAG